MAADILVYLATHVPVGEDQKQHLELARDIAQKFNHDFDVNYFPLTEPLIFGAATRVMSLRDGTSKMSKSDSSDNSRINLMDGPDLIAKKIRRAKTDSEPLPSEARGLENRPEAENLVGIYAALMDKDRDTVLNEVGGWKFSAFKDELIGLAVSVLGPIGVEMGRLRADEKYIDGVLDAGSVSARELSAPVLRDVFDIIGFIQAP